LKLHLSGMTERKVIAELIYHRANIDEEQEFEPRFLHSRIA